MSEKQIAKEKEAVELQVMTVSQVPKIKENIKTIGAEVRKIIKDLGIEAMVATPETIQSLKKTRAALNKREKKYREQDKFVRDTLAKPYTEIKDILNKEVYSEISGAVEILSKEIDTFEFKIKQATKENLESFFAELCAIEKIDFISFADLKIDVKLSVTEKKYKEEITSFVEKVVSDLELINTQEFNIEILVEYKKDLNVSRAITEINSRKEKEKAEALRIKKERNLSRIALLRNHSFVFVDITNCYEYNESIYIEIKDIEEKEDAEFNSFVASFLAAQKEEKAKAAELEREEAKEATTTTTTTEQKSTPAPKAYPIPAPTVTAPAQQEKQAEAIATATFKVTAERSKLYALAAYMKENKIEYKNI